jgi:murein DD-endopeptidase MepM/ murein hydrolase activator NlpD
VLNVRPAPNTSQAPVGTLDNGAIVDVLGIVTGENVQGNTTWFHVSSPAVSGYVSGVFAECTTAEAPEPPKGYYLPLKCGSSAKVTQGPNGGVSHQGAQKYAYDFALPLNTPVVAMADGTVSHVSLNAKPGDPCYNGGGSSCAPYANRLAIKHADGKSTYYTHLNQVKVTVGQVVTRGSEIGLSGSTGWSTGPHLHVQKQESCGSVSCTSISITFEDAGQPPAGAVVNSKNCP